LLLHEIARAPATRLPRMRYLAVQWFIFALMQTTW